MKVPCFSFVLLLTLAVPQIYSGDKILFDPLSIIEPDLTNPLKAEVSYDKSSEIADLITGMWIGKVENTECSDGSPLAEKAERKLLLLKFVTENDSFFLSEIGYDEVEPDKMTSLREMRGKFEMVAETSEAPLVGLCIRAEISKFRDSRDGPFNELDQARELLIFIDPVRSNQQTLVIGLPSPKGASPCPEGEITVLELKRPDL